MLIMPEQQRVLTKDIVSLLAIVQCAVLLSFVPLVTPIIASVMIISPAIILVRARLNKSYALNRWLKIAITVSAALLVFYEFKTFRGKDAGVALIVVMYSLKILESKNYRDLNVILTMGFFISPMSFLFTQSPIAVLYSFFVFGLIVYALFRANSVQVISVNWRKSAKLIFACLPIMIFLFLFFPRLSQPLWRMPGQDIAQTGISDSMTPGDIGGLNLSDEPAFRVQFIDNQLVDFPLYWRGLVFDEYDGLTWRRSERELDELSEFETNPESLNQQVINQQITLEPTQNKFLFGLDRPIKSGQKLAIKTNYTFESRFKINQRIKYDIASVPDKVIGLTLSDSERSANTAIPNSGNEQARDWARANFLKLSEPAEFVLFLQRFIHQNEYFYTLSPPIMRENMIDDFWFNHRKGFCEHYASSFVFMLRAVGIPARVVVGYQGGEYNPIGNYYLIRQSDAHAWAEVWLEKRGWVRVDPTAAIHRSRILDDLVSEVGLRGFLFDQLPVADLIQVSWLDYPRQWLDNANRVWKDWIIDFNSQSQFNIHKWLNLDKLTKPLLIVLFLFIALIITYIITRQFQPRSKKLDELSKSMEKLLIMLQKNGWVKPPGQTVEAFLNQVKVNNLEFEAKLVSIAQDYSKARYKSDYFNQRQLTNIQRKIKALNWKSIKHRVQQ